MTKKIIKELIFKQYQHSPDFIGRVSLYSTDFPAFNYRVYVHSSCCDGQESGKLTELERAIKFVNSTSKFIWNPQHSFFLGFSRKDNELLKNHNTARELELYGYPDFKDILGINKIYTYLIDENHNSKDPNQMTSTLTDSLVILGQEEIHRRKSLSISDYILNPPIINGLSFERISKN